MTPAARSPARSASTMAPALRMASFPLRRMQTFPLFSVKAAASLVTLGRLS